MNTVNGGTVKEGTILLVDDQPDQIKVIKAALDQHFFVKVAIRGELVLPIAAEGGVDLILLDILMPGMDGYEVCRRLKENPRTAETPVIFLTCKDTQDDETVGLRLGAVDFIRKPSSASVVLARCRNTISHQRVKEDLRRKNEELRLALKVREDMERVSRHDLKGPLSGILGLPEIMLLDHNYTDNQRNLLKLIERSGYIMLDMINRSLDLYKMENNTYQLRSEDCDLVEILKHVTGGLEKLIQTKRLKIVITLEGSDHAAGPFQVRGERMLCYSVFYNVLLNAIEASNFNSEIRIHLAPDGDMGAARITNSGEVPEAIRERFFDKYVTHGKEHGSGLGTYSAWLAIKTQGGRMELDASQPGQTSVIVTLPRPGR
ncbi:Sensor histidine kinase RcsC [Candidatus Magnetaquicoccaceae bacterium FCR-1]|uniref:histidine kinase n=1 Tax=Candidatus Magnetaquiglobus chichijimensis TaxID=3141448 RepID=A0ABQ0C528_9PROT